MAVPVQHKRSATPGAVPTTAALLAGQIALNTYDGRAFFKKSVSGTESIVELATTAAMAATYLPLTGGTLSGAVTLNGIEVTQKDDITTRTSGGMWQSNIGTFARGWPLNSGDWQHLIASTHSNVDNYYSMQLAADFFSQRLFYRSTAGNGATAWSEIVHANNVGSFALPISGGVVNGAVSADYFVSWGSSSARGYAAVFAGDASHSGYVSFNAAGGAARGYIGYCDASQMTIATQYDADLAFVRNGVEKFRIGSTQSSIGALFLSGALTFCADAWNTSADAKNRLYFQTNGRSFYGSQDGHQFQSSSNGMVGFIGNDGTMQISGNSLRISTSSTPVNGTTTGNAGEIRWDASYIYVCTSANTWKRAALSSF